MNVAGAGAGGTGTVLVLEIFGRCLQCSPWLGQSQLVEYVHCYRHIYLVTCTMRTALSENIYTVPKLLNHLSNDDKSTNSRNERDDASSNNDHDE